MSTTFSSLTQFKVTTSKISIQLAIIFRSIATTALAILKYTCKQFFREKHVPYRGEIFPRYKRPNHRNVNITHFSQLYPFLKEGQKTVKPSYTALSIKKPLKICQKSIGGLKPIHV